jgi:hypothetical protein
MTIAIIITLVVLAIITWIVIAVNAATPLPPCCMRCLDNNCRCLHFQPYCCDHYSLNSIRSKLSEQERLIWELRRDFELNRKLATKPIFYAKSIKEQEQVDLIEKSRKAAEQIAKDLELVLPLQD